MKYIYYSNADIFVTIKNKRQISALLIQLFKKEKKQLNQLQYVFCSDEFLLKINKQYLLHDTYTDIITFDLSSPGDKKVDGEVYISYPRVKENASKYEVRFYDELLRVIIHGALHLCGYKDKTKKEQINMRKKEDEYLQIFQQLK